jgi:hypothetical protein
MLRMRVLARSLMALAALLILVWLFWPRALARAHVGVPHPVLLEQPLGPYVVSVLADPDVGVGTFIVQVVLAVGGQAGGRGSGGTGGGRVLGGVEPAVPRHRDHTGVPALLLRSGGPVGGRRTPLSPVLRCGVAG